MQELTTTHHLVKNVQSISFPEEFKAIYLNEQLRNSKLLSLNPFRESHGLLQLGGRLQHSNLSYTAKFNCRQSMHLPHY